MYVGEGPVVGFLSQVWVLVALSLWAVFVFLGLGTYLSGSGGQLRLISALSV